MNTGRFETAVSEMEDMALSQELTREKTRILKGLISLIDESLNRCEEAHLAGDKYVSPFLAIATQQTFDTADTILKGYEINWRYSAALNALYKPQSKIKLTISHLFSLQKVIFNVIAPLRHEIADRAE